MFLKYINENCSENDLKKKKLRKHFDASYRRKSEGYMPTNVEDIYYVA